MAITVFLAQLFCFLQALSKVTNEQFRHYINLPTEDNEQISFPAVRVAVIIVCLSTLKDALYPLPLNI